MDWAKKSIGYASGKREPIEVWLCLECSGSFFRFEYRSCIVGLRELRDVEVVGCFAVPFKMYTSRSLFGTLLLGLQSLGWRDFLLLTWKSF